MEEEIPSGIFPIFIGYITRISMKKKKEFGPYRVNVLNFYRRLV